MTTSWRWLGWTLLAVAAAALIGIGVSSYMLSSWSELVPATSEEADREFTVAIEEAGGGPAYVEVTTEGEVRVRRELERPERTRLATLQILAWEPDNGKLLRIGFPFWFVRAKMTDAINLGTITSALARDWENLDLKVSVEELERSGPGIVLDHRLEDGTRILLWTREPAAR